MLDVSLHYRSPLELGYCALSKICLHAGFVRRERSIPVSETTSSILYQPHILQSLAVLTQRLKKRACAGCATNTSRMGKLVQEEFRLLAALHIHLRLHHASASLL